MRLTTYNKVEADYKHNGQRGSNCTATKTVLRDVQHCSGVDQVVKTDGDCEKSC